jgi:transcriptional regulator with XRE-family HTH domain
MRPTEIIEARERLGLTQSEVAHRARVSEQTVSRIERGIRVRPNSLKDVYAVLNLPYAGLDTTELVVPERLRTDPDTDALLATAATLPNVRYLARPDPAGWANYVWALIRANPLRGTYQRTNAFPLVFGGLIVIVHWVGCIYTLYDNYGNPNFEIFFLVAAILGFLGFFIGMFVYWYAQDDYKKLWGYHDERIGYAFSTDVIWKLTIQDRDIAVERIPLDDVEGRRVDPDGPFMSIIIRHGSDETVIAMIPQHSGLTDLIAQPRPMDRFRSFPLEPGMPQVA